MQGNNKEGNVYEQGKEGESCAISALGYLSGKCG